MQVFETLSPTPSLTQLSVRHCTNWSLNKNIFKLKSKLLTGICLPGSYGRKLHKNNIAIHPCLPCDIGYYQPSQGQFSCLKCPNIISTTLKKGSIFETDCMDIELKNPCLKFPCRNNGSCFLENTFAACSCPEGFIGKKKLKFSPQEKFAECDNFFCYFQARFAKNL